MPSVADLVEEGAVGLDRFGPLEVVASVEEGAEKYEVELRGRRGTALVVHVPRGTKGQFLQALRRGGEGDLATLARSQNREIGERPSKPTGGGLICARDTRSQS
jgi:hypothetical protein